MWLSFSLLSGLLYALVNHLDKYLISRVLKGRSVGALVIFSSMIGFVVAAVILVVKPGVLYLPTNQILILIGCGILYIVNLICYFYALESDDTSVVAPMYQLVPVFALFTGGVVLREAVSWEQIMAGLIVMVGAMGLGTNPGFKDFKINKRAVGLMLLASGFTALSTTLFKLGDQARIDLWTAAFWEYVGFGITAGALFIAVKSYRDTFLKMIRRNGKVILGVNVLNEVLATGANLTVQFATLLTPMAVVLWVAEGAQPLFVVLVGWLIAKVAPRMADEATDRKTLVWRVAWIGVMLVGTYLLV